MSDRGPRWLGPRRGGEREQPDSRKPQVLGRLLPGIALPYAPEGEIDLGELARRFSLVLCLFPAIGTRHADAGDQQRAHVWQQYDSTFARAGYRLIAISSDSPDQQHDWLEEHAPSYVVACDHRLLLARDLGLPTKRRANRRVYQPGTLVIHRQRVAQLFYPVGADDAPATIRQVTRHE